MENLTEAEIQLLIALVELEEPIETVNNNFYEFYPKSLEAAGTYFRKFREDWTEAYETLTQKGLIALIDDRHTLTEPGKERARQLRLKHPPIWYWYREYYLKTAKSKAHARYCERLFGRNMCQHGFADMAQVEKLLEVLRLSPDDRVLDLGCGNGMIAEYLSDQTGARFTGIDYIPEAIVQARERTRDKADRLTFLEMDLDDFDFPADSFDAAISIDTLYFVQSKEEIIARLRKIVRPGGRLASFFLGFAREPNSREHMKPAGTSLAKILRNQNLRFTAHDFTLANYEHLRRKHRIVVELEDAFVAEGNGFLYENLLQESEASAKSFDPDTWPSSRFLYHASIEEEKTIS